MTTTATRVTAVMCTFNGGRFLEAQCASIAQQSMRPHQIVVADDGSEQETIAILDHWDHAWRRLGIDVVRLDGESEPLGVAANFERALNAADGDVIVLSDQDDEWLPDRVSRAVDALGTSDALVLFANADLVDAESRPLGTTLFDALAVSRSEREAFAAGNGLDALVRRNVATGATMAVTSAAVRLALPIPEGWIHDEWLVAAVASTSYGSPRILIDDTPVIRYRLHGGNAIGVDTSRLAGRLNRLTQDRAHRLQRLSTRADAWAQWASSRAAAEVVAILERKAAFERERSRYPYSRIRRLGPVLAAARGGGYTAFASMGKVDIVRDIVQPARGERT